MSISINGTVVFASNTAVGQVYLENIASLDANTEAEFIQAVRAEDHKFITVNSLGTTFETFYGANNDPAGG